MDTPSLSKPPNAKFFWLAWLASIAVATGSFVYLAAHYAVSVKTAVFHQTANGWQALPPLAAAYEMRISGRGVVWVRTSRGLSRLDGGTWHAFTASDFGTAWGYLSGNFTLDGEEVWGAGREGGVRYDGARWRLYREAVATQDATSIAAAKGQVWVVDRDGNLSHFDGGAWSIRKLDLPGVRWGETSWDRYPKLCATPGGPLWLAWQGLWRFDGASWNRVSGVSGETELLGANPPGSGIVNGKQTTARGGVWIRDGGEVIGIDVDGAPAVRYKMRELGLLDSTRIYGVAARIPVWAVATSQGVVWFDGSQWHGEQIPKLGIKSVSSVAVAPDGSVWGFGRPPREYSANFIAASVALLSIPVLVIVPPIWWVKRKRRQSMQEAVLHATGSLPKDLSGNGPSWMATAAGVVLVLGLGGGSYWLVKKQWPAAPVWLFPAFLVAAHAIATVTGALKERKPLPYEPIGPDRSPRIDWEKSAPAILGGLAVLLLVYGGSIARHFHIRWLAAVPGLAFLLGGRFLFHAFDALRSHRVEREIKRCRYQAALEILDGPLGWPPTGLMKLNRVDALFFSGRAGDAEAILKEVVETKHGLSDKALAFERVGRVSMAQGRHEDARRAFEAAAKLMPNRSAAYAGLAEIRLRQGVEPAKALEDAERALRCHRDSLVERKRARERLAIIRGNQAWALASLGRGAEASEAIEAGVRETGPGHTPELAGLYWRAGMAMLAVDNTTGAVRHFRRAAELDPQGYYGKLAAQHLSAHSVWGTAGLARV